ncbi:hypothetical protein OG625_35820 [Streptomyces sp. NBC_01351]|uniref:hypothetical protein n=1 Tax=Streptomyces sp. NBC_01351 TaxID=2903833 RepID=UPI002E366D0C|nr:hypothetical protein [Streptomyces sp. NBC_01351]
MSVLPTIAVVLAAWFAAGLVVAALYAAVRGRHVRRQRAAASALDGAAAGGPCAPAEEPSDLSASA